MKTLNTFLLLALLSAGKITEAKGSDSTTKTHQTKQINLEIKGLFKELSSDWYIPNEHIIYLNLVPSEKGVLHIESIETSDLSLQVMLRAYFAEKGLHVKGSVPMRVCVKLKN